MLCEFLGDIECICGFKIQVAEEGKLTTNCPSCHCNVIQAISNRMQYTLKQKINEYYNNRFKCRCDKTYALNLIGDCCKIKYKPRSNVPFEIHELIYVVRDLCAFTLKFVSKKDVIDRIGNLDRKLE